jgi:hypothetical protein
MIKVDGLVLLISLGLTLYAVIDCAMTPQEKITGLPKWGWLLLIFLFSGFAAIAWIIWGKPKGNRPPRRRRGTIPPDDNPDFLKRL